MLLALLEGGGFFAGLQEQIQSIAFAIVTVWGFWFFVFWSVVVLFVLFEAGINHRYWTTGVLLTLILAFLLLMGVIAPVAIAIAYPWYTVGVILSYIVIGSLWVFFRWNRFLNKVIDQRNAVIKEFLSQPTLKYDAEKRKETDWKELSDEQISEWTKHVNANSFAPEEPRVLTYSLTRALQNESRLIGTATESPKFQDNKSEYAAYFFYWPLDMAIYILGDLLRDVWEWVVEMVQGTLNRYARNRLTRQVK